MDKDEIERILNAYEEKLKVRNPEFEFSPFEKLIMEECLVHGYELKQNHLDNITVKEIEG